MSGTVVDKGLATNGVRRAVPNLGQDRQQHQRVDRNPGTVPNPKKVRKVEKKGDYHLNCWNLWWQQMEREGGRKGGREEGREEGRKGGREQGREQGRKAGRQAGWRGVTALPLLRSRLVSIYQLQNLHSCHSYRY